MKKMKLKLFKYKFYLTACEIKIQPPPLPPTKKKSAKCYSKSRVVKNIYVTTYLFL